MREGQGHKFWCVPDLYLKNNGERSTPSHESITLLNLGEATADIEMILLFSDKEIVLNNIQLISKKRMQIRTDELEKWDVVIPREVGFSVVIKSNVNIIAEYARLNWIDGYAQSFAIIPYYED